ncbi:MAG: hypothetical protein ACHQVS_00750 [Candidatus Babeliales bacterium]
MSHMNKSLRKQFVNEMKRIHGTIIRDLGDMKIAGVGWEQTFAGKTYKFLPMVNNYDLRKEYADALIQEALKNLENQITHTCSPECYDSEESPCQRTNPWHYIDIILDAGVGTRRTRKKKERSHVISSMGTKTSV